jgi:ATP synthase protein I
MGIRLAGQAESAAQIDRAFRLTMIWQAAGTITVALLAAFVVGRAGFLSAVMGGGIGIAGLWAFALMSKRRIPGSGVVRVALRAEAAKVVVIVLLLWLAFAVYRDMVVLAFFGAFMVSVLLSGIAFAVSGD